ncbi:MAG: VWA domain-containing protein [Gammaproteobacteria bacterium]|nr:VWA domain-containing protein [Gammaproteobacteria bacterium]
MFQFEWPWVFLALPLPLLVYYLFPAGVERHEAALRVPFLQDFRLSQQTELQSRRKFWLKLMCLMAWLLLVAAGSRPQFLGESIGIDISGRDLMMAVDLSDSMRIGDFKINGDEVNRLVATKYVASQFIERRKGDRLGLILFGSRAYLQAPLTFDTKTINQLLLESAIGLAGERTAIGDAIGLSLKRLEQSDYDSRVLILITDGANTAGEVTPLKAAELAAEHGLKIYTIGVGADEQIKSTWFGVRKINPSAQLDEKTLRGIAEMTGGRYFRARDTEEFEQIYKVLDELEPLNREQQTLRPVETLFYWPLSAALLLSLIVYLQTLWGRQT